MRTLTAYPMPGVADGYVTASGLGLESRQDRWSAASSLTYDLNYDLVRAHALTREASAAMIRAALEEYEACESPPA